MSKSRQINVRIDAELYRNAKWKAEKIGFPLATLVRVFLKSFTTQAGVGFYIGDQDLAKLFNNWMGKKQLENAGSGRLNASGPRLKDIFELSDIKRVFR